jgi:6-phosphogluconolactonase
VSAIAPQQLVIEATPRLAEVAAEWFAAAVEADVRDRGRCAVALAGGDTARPLYERLAGDPFARRISWRDVEVFFGDERAVPPDDPASNYRMAAASLLGRVPIPPAQVHRMEAERADRDTAARDYDRLLPGQLDVLLLGVGADGHTASLFPDSAALEERVRRVMPVLGPKPPAERLTITPPVVSAARRVAVLVAGASKAAVVARVLRGPLRPRDLPAQLALGGTWFLDREAAAALRSEEA